MIDMGNRWKSVTARGRWAAGGASLVAKVKATKAVWLPPKADQATKKAASTTKKATKAAPKKSARTGGRTAKKTAGTGKKAAKKTTGAAKKTTRRGS